MHKISTKFTGKKTKTQQQQKKKKPNQDVQANTLSDLAKKAETNTQATSNEASQKSF